MSYADEEDARFHEALEQLLNENRQAWKKFSEAVPKYRRPVFFCSKEFLDALFQDADMVRAFNVDDKRLCDTCNDDCIVESPYDTGPGLAPCFETCPAIHEPWHVKR